MSFVKRICGKRRKPYHGGCVGCTRCETDCHFCMYYRVTHGEGWVGEDRNNRPIDRREWEESKYKLFFEGSSRKSDIREVVKIELMKALLPGIVPSPEMRDPDSCWCKNRPDLEVVPQCECEVNDE